MDAILNCGIQTLSNPTVLFSAEKLKTKSNYIADIITHDLHIIAFT